MRTPRETADLSDKTTVWYLHPILLPRPIKNPYEMSSSQLTLSSIGYSQWSRVTPETSE